MSSVARLCALALTVLFQVSVWHVAWSSAGFFGDIAASPTDDGTPAQNDDGEPEGTTDDRSTPMADDIFELTALPVAVPRVWGADVDGRIGPAFDELCRRCPAPDAPDKPPRA